MDGSCSHLGIEFFKNCSDSSSYDQSASLSIVVQFFYFSLCIFYFNEILKVFGISIVRSLDARMTE